MFFKVKYSTRIIIITSLLSVCYAILRYHIVGEVPWKDLPFYVLNKGVALAAIILLTLSFSVGPLKVMGIHMGEKWLDSRKDMGITGFVFTFVHIFMSISILNPNYYTVFFTDDGTLTLRGGLSLFAGIISFVLLWVYNISFKSVSSQAGKINSAIIYRNFLVYGMLFSGVHLFFMGYSGWTTFYKWQGGLPPISLISFIVFAFGYLVNFMGRKKNTQRS